MISRRILGAAAALALVLPLIASSTSFAQQRRAAGGGHRAAVAAPRTAGGAQMGRYQGQGMYRGAAIGPGQRAAAIAATPGGMQPGSPGWQTAARYSPGGWRTGAFWPGFATGATIGTLGSYAYYGGSPYYGDSAYSGDESAEEPSFAAMPDTGADTISYCVQRFRSFDPASGTYLGFDGQRHPCP